jgi:ABC-type branched-subunit amino acid transport system ATPase component
MSEANPASLLEVRELTKRFGGVLAIDDISFDVRSGETLAIVGPNGSGKTTTFNAIAGTVAADSGRVLLADRDVTRLPAERRAELGIARTFQSGRAFGNATVLENVLAAHRPRTRLWRPLALVVEVLLAVVRPPSVRRAWDDERAASERGLAAFGADLILRESERAYGLSYADRRRLEIARGLARDPRVLLLDEPAAGMNARETDDLARQIATLRARGLTIVVIEHKLDFIAQIADRVIVLDGGRVIFEGTPAAARRDAAVIAAYVGTEAATARPPARATLTDAAPLLALRDIDVSYGPINALRDVSLEIARGEIVCLLGANAAGKSTTMRTILGLVRPDRGSIAIDGRDCTQMTPRERIRAGLGSVPEGRHVFPAMSVEENLLLGAYARGRERSISGDLERTYDLFPRLRERRLQRAGTLSGGEQQMLATGRALMGRPRLLCLDEPTMGLSPALADRVFELLRELNADGTTIFLVEQNAAAALAIAHRGYVLRAGEIVLAGPSETLLADEALRDAYLGEAER